MSSWFKRYLALLLFLIIFLGLGFSFGLNQSFTAGLDKTIYFQFIWFIAGPGRLPLTSTERGEAGYKSDLPPLFHLWVGSTGGRIDLSFPPFVKSTESITAKFFTSMDFCLSFCCQDDADAGEILPLSLFR